MLDTVVLLIAISGIFLSTFFNPIEEKKHSIIYTLQRLLAISL